MFAPNFRTNCPYWLYIWIWCVGDLGDNINSSKYSFTYFNYVFYYFYNIISSKFVLNQNMHEAGWSATDIKIGCHEQNTFFYTADHSGKYDIFKELKSFKGEHFSGGSFLSGLQMKMMTICLILGRQPRYSESNSLFCQPTKPTNQTTTFATDITLKALQSV